MSDKTMSPSKSKLGYNITGKAPKPLGSYSHAVKAGGFLFVAGQGARNADTGEEAGVTVDSKGTVVSYDIEASSRRM